MATLTLRRGRERSLVRRHPWVFSGAVESVDGSPGSGDTVEIRAHDGRWLARGAYSPASQIRARVWTFDQDEAVDVSFFERRIVAAARLRSACALDGSAQRLVYSESDRLPGLVVDRYAGHLVCQILSAGAERWRDEIVGALAAGGPASGVYERSDSSSRRLEGLEPRTGVLAGEEPPELVEIAEAGRRYLVDVRSGHKTGFYLDQRSNRTLLEARARDTEVLDCFTYTGGFAVAAARGGARAVTCIESSAAAAALAERNAELNEVGPERLAIQQGDVFQLLRAHRDEGRSYDLIVLDPPKFAESRGQVEAAARGYKDLNLLAFKLLRPGGLLFTFSCSGHMKPDLFQKIVADAALDAGRDAAVLEALRQAPDHPTALPFPEASYLKGLLVRVR